MHTVVGDFKLRNLHWLVGLKGITKQTQSL